MFLTAAFPRLRQFLIRLPRHWRRNGRSRVCSLHRDRRRKLGYSKTVRFVVDSSGKRGVAERRFRRGALWLWFYPPRASSRCQVRADSGRLLCAVAWRPARCAACKPSEDSQSCVHVDKGYRGAAWWAVRLMRKPVWHGSQKRLLTQGTRR